MPARSACGSPAPVGWRWRSPRRTLSGPTCPGGRAPAPRRGDRRRRASPRRRPGPPTPGGARSRRRRYRPSAAACARRPSALEDRQEGFLRYLDLPDLLHALLSFLLPLEQLALARDVTAVALGGHVLAHGLDGLPRDDAAADGRLDGHLEHLAGNDAAELLHQHLPPLVGLVAVDDDTESIDRVAVEQDVELDQLRGPEVGKLVVERGVALGDRLQPIVEVHHDLGQREVEAD